MKFIDSIRERLTGNRGSATAGLLGKEAAIDELLGKPVVRQRTWAQGTRDRNITPALLVEDRNVAPVIAALGGLSGICFPGFDFVLKPTEDGADVQSRINKVLPEIKRLDARIGRVGNARNTGTIGLIRRAFLEGYTFRQAIVEFAMVRDGQWENFSDIQILPGQTFASASPETAGQDRYIPDPILPGVVADTVDDVTRFFQSVGVGKFQELHPGNVMYIQDTKIPDNTSLLKAIVPSIEAWKEVRRDAMLAMHRVGVPNQVAQLDAVALAKLAGAKLMGQPNQPTILDVQKYAETLVKNQGIDRTQLSLAGMKLQYPAVPVPIDPWKADALLQKEIIDFFFHTNVLEVTAQAISATNAPSAALLDNHVVGERATYGRPFEGLWTRWLALNGYDDIRVEFNFWNWSPKDQAAEKAHQLESFDKGSMLINDYRAMNGWPEYSNTQLAQLMAEQDPGEEGVV